MSKLKVFIVLSLCIKINVSFKTISKFNKLECIIANKEEHVGIVTIMKTSFN